VHQVLEPDAFVYSDKQTKWRLRNPTSNPPFGHDAIPAIIQKWEPTLGVKVAGYFLQRMKTKWGSCNHRAGNIRLNTELVKKPKDLLEYVVVHEMLHLIAPTHSEQFLALMSKHYPTWREARAELNELPSGAVVWNE